MFSQALSGREILEVLYRKSGLTKENFDILRNKDEESLGRLIQDRIANIDVGIDFNDWLIDAPSARRSMEATIYREGVGLFDYGKVDKNIKSPRIRTDVDLLVCILYSKFFPFFNETIFVPANGCVHTYNESILNHRFNMKRSTLISVLTTKDNLYFHPENSAEEIVESIKGIVKENLRIAIYGNNQVNLNEFDGIYQLTSKKVVYNKRIHDSLFDLTRVYNSLWHTGIYRFAYLGTPYPSVLELPIGFGGSYARLFIPFLMNGLIRHG